MIDGMARIARTLALALGLLIVAASPAGADPAGPSDFRSEVTGVTPGDVVTADIRGGDAFLELTVSDGHTVIVQGYGGEPYLRFQPDGTVERNRLSTATYLNEDRRGAGITIPPDAAGRRRRHAPRVGHHRRRRRVRLARPPGALDGRRVPQRRSW